MSERLGDEFKVSKKDSERSVLQLRGEVRHWTAEEELYLEEKWGVLSRKTIAKNLDRTVISIREKAQALGLGDPLTHIDGITISQLSIVLNTHYNILRRWIDEFGMPASRRTVSNKQQVVYIRYEHFWEWAEKHQHLLNFSKLERLSLGPEPDWADKKRRLDTKNVMKRKKRPWTREDIGTLRGMANSRKYTYPDFIEFLGRSHGAIKRKLYDLNLPNPIRMKPKKWSELEEQTAVSMYKKGYGFNSIASKLGRSDGAVRTKMELLGYQFNNGIPRRERVE